ncbi:NUDIX hydrolase [Actinophytocola gossypii]|uniref:NUDIX hydrolase n=1 Tax=Actinophytocola gossypii TaxID=2812003 RepID=A0ABT2JDA0_9PSEU|nr:NUDIX hydrolase [Actinophytocola gossypii]MCT2585830.1 NUDIX hydrolase [Actinophytocola gossypii]
MRWTVHGERRLYSSPWMSLELSDVERPDGVRWEHHVVRLRGSVGIAVLDPADRVLMVWRHRFTTDTWNWELPGGWVDPGESPRQAAAREAEEETGWRPARLRELTYLQPVAGITDAEQWIYVADRGHYTGPPVDAYESDRIDWIPLADVPELIRSRRIVGGVSVAGLLQLIVDRAEEQPRRSVA